MAKLGSVGLTKIAAAIEELDPEQRFVQLDVQNKTVTYTDEIQLGQAIYSYEGEEEPVRAYIVCWLCTLGGYLPGNIELEKRYSIGRPKGGEGARLDVLVKHPDGVPYALIEVKAPDEYEKQADELIEGQLFNIAPHEPGCSVLVYATVEVLSGVKILSLTIDYRKLDLPRFGRHISVTQHPLLPV